MKYAAAAGVIAFAAVAHAGGGSVRGVVEVNRPRMVAPGPVLVYVVGFTERSTGATVEIKQVGRRFVPDLVGVTAGGTVAFPNGDPFLHNVFSPTSARAFDLGSFKQGESRSRTFPSPGVVDVYCNLHPEMSATVVILPNTRFAIADANGQFEIGGVPAGQWTVFAYSRHAAQPVSTTVSVAAGAATEIKLRLDEVPRDFGHRNKYGETYRGAATVYAPGS